jgi:hypothetical protein
MNRRIQLWLGVSACALLGVTTLPATALAQAGQGNAQDVDPDGGMANECGESGGCAEAGESFESRTNDELGDEADELRNPPVILRLPRSDGGGLSDGDSVSGSINDGGLGD